MIKMELSKRSLKYIRGLEKAAERPRFFAAVRKRWHRTGLRAAGKVSKNYLSGQRRARRTGQLAGAIIGRGEMLNGVPAMRMGVLRGPALRYAGVQEYGTKGKNPSSPYDTIKSKRPGGALAMPVNDSLTAAGVGRYTGPRDDPRELRFIPVHRGKLIGVLVETEDGPAQYLLLRSVEVAPGFFLRDGMEATIPELGRDVADLVGKALRGEAVK